MVQKEIFSRYRCNIISVFNILHLTEALVNTPGLMKTFVLILLAIFVVLLSTACAERQCNACGPECSGQYKHCNSNVPLRMCSMSPQSEYESQPSGQRICMLILETRYSRFEFMHRQFRAESQPSA